MGFIMKKKVIITAPAGAIDPGIIDAAAEQLTERGMQVEITPHAKGAFGRFSGTPEERLKDLEDALCSDADYVLCARGGYGVAQIIDKLQMPARCVAQSDLAQAVEGRMPRVIGFSDITALHGWMGQRGVVSVHANMCKDIAEWEMHREGNELLLQVMAGEPLQYALPSHPLNRLGAAKGTLRGGNLSILISMQGTPFACPVEPGNILFIEDIGEHPYAIDRMMQNLRLSGMLSRLGGLVVGQFSGMEEDPKMPYSVYEGIRKMVEPYDYPVVLGFPAGHVDRNLPLLMNAPCELRVEEDGVRLLQ